MVLEICSGRFSEPELQEHISKPWSPQSQLVGVSWAVPKLCEHFPANLQRCKLFMDVGIDGRWVRPPERGSLHDSSAPTKFPWDGWVQAQFAGPALHGRAGRAFTACSLQQGHKTLRRCWRSKSCSAAPGTTSRAWPWHGSTGRFTPSFGGTGSLEGSLLSKGAVVSQPRNV